MSLAELYQELILDHNRSPRNCGALKAPTHSATGHNPLCGDHLTLELRLAEGRVAEVAFEGSGCAISTASASLMTDAVKGLDEGELEALFAKFHALATGDGPPAGEMGKLGAFGGIRDYPTRVKCATLAWNVLEQGLQENGASRVEEN